jgi:hypothetical protein
MQQNKAFRNCFRKKDIPEARKNAIVLSLMEPESLCERCNADRHAVRLLHAVRKQLGGCHRKQLREFSAIFGSSASAAALKLAIIRSRLNPRQRAEGPIAGRYRPIARACQACRAR